jgi:hypothetical protein
MSRKTDEEIKAIADQVINYTTEFVLTKLWTELCIGIEPAENMKDGILLFHGGKKKKVKNANLRFWKNMKQVFLEAKRFCDKRIKEIMEE